MQISEAERQRGGDAQQVGEIKDRDGYVLTRARSVMGK